MVFLIFVVCNSLLMALLGHYTGVEPGPGPGPETADYWVSKYSQDQLELMRISIMEGKVKVGGHDISEILETPKVEHPRMPQQDDDIGFFIPVKTDLAELSRIQRDHP